MPLSDVQQGTIAQQEFLKLLMWGSDGQIGVTVPVTDDERRDLETHIRGEFGRASFSRSRAPDTDNRLKLVGCKFEERLQKAGKTAEIVTYAGAPHGLLADGATDHAAAISDALGRTYAFLGRTLKAAA